MLQSPAQFFQMVWIKSSDSLPCWHQVQIAIVISHPTQCIVWCAWSFYSHYYSTVYVSNSLQSLVEFSGIKTQHINNYPVNSCCVLQCMLIFGQKWQFSQFCGVFIVNFKVCFTHATDYFRFQISILQIIIISFLSTCKPLSELTCQASFACMLNWVDRMHVYKWMETDSQSQCTVNYITLSHLQSGTCNLEMIAAQGCQWFCHKLVPHLTQIRS